MAIPSRASRPGTFFVTSGTHNRRRLFQVERPAELLIETLQRYRAEGHYGGTGMKGGTVNSTLTIATTASLLPSTYPFTVSMTNTGAGCQNNRPTGSGSLVVGNGSTTTTVTNTAALAAATVVGQAYPVTYSVAAGTGTPTGTVTVTDGTATCSASVTAGACSLTSTSSGTKNITATYSGDTNFTASTSNVVSHPVNAAGTTTTLASSVNPSLSGQSVTFTATVTVTLPGSGSVPLGSVITFKDGSTTLGTGTTNSSGVATYSTTALTDGNHSITAVYPGNADFTTSTSSAVAQLVKGAAVFSSLVPQVASITYGNANISISGQVANASKTVFASSGETVTVTIHGTPLPVTIQGNSGNFSGTFDTHAIPVSGSPYTISYSYPGDTNLTASTDASTKLTINKATLTVTANDLSTVYGAAVPAYTSVITGFVNGEPQSVVTGNASLTTSPAIPSNAGTYTITAAAGTLTAANYTFVFVNGTLTINKAIASVTPNAASKTYGTADPALTGTLSGFLDADAVTATYSRAAGETVAGGPYSISAVLSPAAVLGNYTITYNTATFTIEKRTLTVTATAANRTYDGTTVAAVTLSDNRIAGDMLNVTSTSATFSDRNAGNSKTVTVTGISISGTDVANYLLGNTTATTTADIAQRQLEVTSSPDTKTYDGNTTSIKLPLITTGSLVSGDTASYSQVFDSRNAGARSLLPSIIIADGNGGQNYSNVFHSVAGTITQLTIVGSITASDKTYDATTLAAIATRALSGVLGSDAVNYTGGSAVFSDSNAGFGKVVTATGLYLTGTDAGNYLVNGIATTTATILKANQAISWSTPDPIIFGTSLSSAQLNAVVTAVPGGTAPGVLTYTLGLGTIPGVGSNIPLTVVAAGTSNYNTATATVKINVVYSTETCLGSLGHAILQPINIDGTSTFKQGSTVPVKFRVCDAAGNSIGTPGVVSNFNLVQILSGTVSTPVDEAVTSTTPDSSFRWDPTAQQWIFNVSTKPLSTHATYVYSIGLNDGSTITFSYGLPK